MSDRTLETQPFKTQTPCVMQWKKLAHRRPTNDIWTKLISYIKLFNVVIGPICLTWSTLENWGRTIISEIHKAFKINHHPRLLVVTLSNINNITIARCWKNFQDSSPIALQYFDWWKDVIDVVIKGLVCTTTHGINVAQFRVYYNILYSGSNMTRIIMPANWKVLMYTNQSQNGLYPVHKSHLSLLFRSQRSLVFARKT